MPRVPTTVPFSSWNLDLLDLPFLVQEPLPPGGPHACARQDCPPLEDGLAQGSGGTGAQDRSWKLGLGP